MEDAVIFRSLDGTKLTGLLAEVSTDYVVILCHGFRGSKEGKTVTRLMKELVGQGVSTFRFDFFAHGTSDGDFADMTISNCTDGILSAIKMLQQMEFKKIGLMGVSMGGVCALLAASKNKDIQFLSLKSPVSDYPELERNRKNVDQWKTNGYIEITTKSGKTYRQNYSFYEDALQTVGYDLVKEITIPVHVVHGGDDKLVPLEQSKKLVKLLPHAHLEIVEGADHFYHKPEDFEQCIHLMVDFIVEQTHT